LRRGGRGPLIDLLFAACGIEPEIVQAAEPLEIAAGVITDVAQVGHLIAMKLHALRSPARVENGIDLQDVKYLIKAAKIDTSSKEFTDIVWGYPAPIPECSKIENLLCFYDEKVDAVYVDGELQAKPVTPWS